MKEVTTLDWNLLKAMFPTVVSGMFNVSQNGGPFRWATVGTFTGGPLFGWIWERNKRPEIIHLAKAKFPIRSNVFETEAQAILETRDGDIIVCDPIHMGSDDFLFRLWKSCQSYSDRMEFLQKEFDKLSSHQYKNGQSSPDDESPTSSSSDSSPASSSSVFGHENFVQIAEIPLVETSNRTNKRKAEVTVSNPKRKIRKFQPFKT